jgi:dolichol-phosphate mannosyltransferase
MYNEEAGAERAVARIGEVLRERVPTARLVVVDDGSRDRTLERLRAARRAGLDFELVESPANQGYGGALRLGARRAAELGATWALFIDSDLTNPPEEIPTFRAAMTDDVDIVKACRYSGGARPDVPLKRRVFSRGGAITARLLGGGPHRDPTNGFRAVRLEPYLELPLQERGFSVILEELYWARRVGLRGVDVPSTLSSRPADLRSTSFHYTGRQLWAYLRWPLRTALERLGAGLWRARPADGRPADGRPGAGSAPHGDMPRAPVRARG